ncbi:YfiR family protein [Massilia sp. YIM B02763]|uniref:YfiR family protein n=1 Tax=Massilia sp. YIM B02763 TaxID=3050130 RepID=UPI0025B62C7C|nr:YfiR family protein [Massilia sp. YIM B02763]MDN4055005.1 YfiR family protein [Massilia sp. YIM B02763]
MLSSMTAVLLALGIACCPRAALAQSQDEQLKAAYIVNIALFTTWPLPAAPAGALAVCASPAHGLWDSLRQLDGRNVNGRRWATVDARGAKACDIAVMAGAHAPRNPPADPGPTLFVVDGAVPGSYAGAVALVEESQHVRFDVDTREAARAGIRFSSRLLRLARNVR